MVDKIGYGHRADGGARAPSSTAMTMRDSWGRPARRHPHDKAYFLDLLGDGHNGLGRHDAAIEAYRQAAEGFRSQGAQCSYALCLFKVADSHLSLGEPWHALGYLEACLPLPRERLVPGQSQFVQQRQACLQVAEGMPGLAQ
jgi:tetratricopeptide (TPR) repeat protein